AFPIRANCSNNSSLNLRFSAGPIFNYSIELLNSCQAPPQTWWLFYLCESLVRVRHRPRSWKVTRPQFTDLEPRRLDDVVNLAIEVAPTADSLPDGRESVLPGNHTRIGSAAIVAGLSDAPREMLPRNKNYTQVATLLER